MNKACVHDSVDQFAGRALLFEDAATTKRGFWCSFGWTGNHRIGRNTMDLRNESKDS
jgi:hypothetical protein